MKKSDVTEVAPVEVDETPVVDLGPSDAAYEDYPSGNEPLPPASAPDPEPNQPAGPPEEG